MTTTNCDRAKVVEFWQLIEMFCPPSIPKVNVKRRVYLARPGELAPWDQGHSLQHQRISRDYTWRHTVYVGVYKVERAYEVLRDAFGEDPDSYDERTGGWSALAAVTVNNHGQVLLGSQIVSTCAWAVGQLAASAERQPPKVEDFVDYAETFGDCVVEDLLEQDLADTYDGANYLPSGPAGETMTIDRLSGFAKKLADELQVGEVLPPFEVRIASVKVPKRNANDVETAAFLNSFFLTDLDRVAGELRAEDSRVGAALEEYLAPPRALDRIDVREHPEVVDEATLPAMVPSGRWPSNPEHPLALSQQFAVNHILRTLRHFAGIVAVNGPPGTGKTTMLRELIAANVVERASQLANLRKPADAFTGTQTFRVEERTTTINIWRPTLTGFEMVVASSNNGAVENVTNEIPAAKAIHPDWDDRVDYFPQTATLLLNVDDLNGDRTKWKPAWAMVAGRLGRMAYRSAFAKAFWSGRQPGKRDMKNDPSDTGTPGVEDFLSEWERRPPPPGQWASAVAEFHAAQQRVTRAQRDRATAVSAAPSPQEVDEATREKSAPWADPTWDAARSDLFLAALALHKAFLAHAAKPMRQNLSAVVELLTGRLPADLDEKAARAIWQSLFFVVPVVSTPFASFDRTFSHLRREALGWLFIDEAGQANPQQAVGAIWRSRRVVVVGDPLQLEPVRSIPIPAQVSIRLHMGIEDRWLPSMRSVQQIADELTPIGTYIRSHNKETKDNEGIWVGAPLRVHRRCDSPMLDISNEIAYDSMMISAVDGRTPYRLHDGLVPPDSKWIHVLSNNNEGHWIPAEGDKLVEIVDWLYRNGMDVAKLMVISPFREVTDKLLGLLEQRYPKGDPRRHLQAGTVHKAQGKEADVVILLLGGDPAKPRAKDFSVTKPNFLNVAVSRARRRLYVVGNYEIWKEYQYFDTLVNRLYRPQE